MRILYISQYFPPEVGATQTRAYEMACGLVKAGHEVTMVTEFPNHPQGVIPSVYRGKWYERQEMDGIDVLRVWVKASPRKDFRRRMTFYISFMVMATLVILLKARGKYDVLYVSSPPLFVGGAGLAITLLRQIPFFFEVRDLWPESAIQLDTLQNEKAIRLATWLEDRCYHQAKHIVVVSLGIQQCLLERGYPAGKLTVIPNGANVSRYRSLPKDPILQGKVGLEPTHFVIAYTGLHGLAHGLETVLESAYLLKSEADIRFLLIGDGPSKKSLQQLAIERSLSNVIFQDAVPERELPNYIALADIGLDTRRKIGISQHTLPVKMFSYMACEKPVILAIEGEAATLIEQACAGLVVPPESPSLLAEAILDLRTDPQKRAKFGRNGRRYVEANYSREALALRLEKVLRQEARITVGSGVLAD